MEYIVRIIAVESVTHNVRRYVLEKPDGFKFEPGQATDVSINETKRQNEKRPFTFTCLNSDPFLEFTIKSYNDHEGITHRLGQLNIGDELIVRDVWGAISYKGPGYFIAGGAGITPFLAILRQLHKEGKLEGNTLFFSNQTDEDIILKNELTGMTGLNTLFTTTKQKGGPNDHRRIDAEFLKAEVDDFGKHFYVCGPDQMVLDINNTLTELGANADLVVFEK